MELDIRMHRERVRLLILGYSDRSPGYQGCNASRTAGFLGVRKGKGCWVTMCKNTQSTTKTPLYVHFFLDLTILSVKVERA